MEFFQQLLNGLNQGAIYALIALGYTMVYGIAKMLNFAHGDVIMVGLYAFCHDGNNGASGIPRSHFEHCVLRGFGRRS